jgi:hypothetical protein
VAITDTVRPWCYCAALVWLTAAEAQVNLGFEDAAPKSSIAARWRATAENTRVEIDTTTAARGVQSLRLTGAAARDGGRVAQDMDPARFNGNRVRVSAHVKVDGSTAIAGDLRFRARLARQFGRQSLADALGAGPFARRGRGRDRGRSKRVASARRRAAR